MTDSGNGGGPKPILAGLTLSTVIQVLTVLGVIVGQWAVLNERMSDIRADVAHLQATVVANRADITSLSIRLSVLEQKHEALREIVIELRRQAGLRSPPEAAPR
jgi:hypothetical protein